MDKAKPYPFYFSLSLITSMIFCERILNSGMTVEIAPIKITNKAKYNGVRYVNEYI